MFLSVGMSRLDCAHTRHKRIRTRGRELQISQPGKLFRGREQHRLRHLASNMAASRILRE